MDTQKDTVKNPIGRPQEYNREEIAQKLLEWSRKEDSLNLCAFCGEIEFNPQMLYKWATEKTEFSNTYNIVKAKLGARRELKKNEATIHLASYNMNAPTYDYFLKQEKRDQAQFEASLKEKEELKIPLSEVLRMAKDGTLTQK